MSSPPDLPPWISKTRVNRAADKLRSTNPDPLTTEDAIVLDAWRAGHRYILNTFQAILRKRTRGKNINVAQRLKRRATISDKLEREPGMQLARMDDIAGCRLIFESISELRSFRDKFHKAKFLHRRRNDADKYDYIAHAHPRSLGYRGIHDIYEYESSSKKSAIYKGLLLELQYRTKCQHAWATAVELITDISGHEPKYNRGDVDHVEFFKLSSEIIARTCEGCRSCYPDLSDAQLIRNFKNIDAKIHLMTFLRGLHPSQGVATRNILVLQLAAAGGLTIHEFSGKVDATAVYFELEKTYPDDNIVLVNADTFAQIRAAYPNYFSDVVEFVRLMDNGRNALEGQQ